MPKKPKISTDDLDAFKKAMTGTRPLPQRKIRLAPVRPPAKRSGIKKCTYEYHLDGLSDTPMVNGDDFISYKHTSVPEKLLRKLRQGQYNVDAVLDLHGMTVATAKKSVVRFIQECMQRELSVLLIIHGKGHHGHMPILKNSLNDWLRKLKMVLAFCSATISHGSRGAVYVLLKNSTEENDA